MFCLGQQGLQLVLKNTWDILRDLPTWLPWTRTLVWSIFVCGGGGGQGATDRGGGGQGATDRGGGGQGATDREPLCCLLVRHILHCMQCLVLCQVLVIL